MANEARLPGSKGTLAETIALWSDRIRDMSATGLKYSTDVYDRQCCETLQNLAIEMLSVATGRTPTELEPLREPVFSRPTPVVAGTAAIIDDEGRILLMRRADSGAWAMPGGYMEVGETPAEAVEREALEETGARCEVVALSGVYDSRLWDTGTGQQLYKFTFLCRPLDRGGLERASHALETTEIGWFPEDGLPAGLYPGHVQRIRDAYRAWRGDYPAHFD